MSTALHPDRPVSATPQRADGVMMHEGPDIPGAVAMLDRILRRMQRHHNKQPARLSISEI